MKEELTPVKIYKNFQNGDLNKEDAADLLTSIINGSEDAKVRKESIEFLEKINYKDDNIFKILENHLLSDEDAGVRASAAKIIILNFLDEGSEPIEWSSKHEKSPLVIKAIIDTLENKKNNQQEAIRECLTSFLAQFAVDLGVVHEEARFFLDLEAIFSFGNANYEIKPQDYKNFERLQNNINSEPWLIINNKHVETLNLNLFSWYFIKANVEIFDSFVKINYLDLYLNTIRKYTKLNFNSTIIPESIGTLSFLKNLGLSRNHLQTIPKSIKNLSSLKNLDLSHNQFPEIPQILKSLSSLEYLNMKYNNFRNIPQSMKNFVNSLTKFEL
ncbi:MAG: hypothetical protein ACFFA3_00445 [Promethearchaeota archaeon]